jgi:electron transfer flavoprotein alpha subunit
MSKCLLVLFEAHEAAAASGFGKALGMPFDMLALKGSPNSNLGAEAVICANLADIPPADGLVKGIEGLCQGYTHFAAVSSMQSKDVMARLAGVLDAAMVTDAISVSGPNQFKRPIVAGSAIATVETLTTPVVVTFRPAGFTAGAGEGQSKVESVTLETPTAVKRVSVTARGGARPDLSQAKIIVSGGRPLKDSATFESVIGGLADAMNGAVGATRAAVDSGIAPNELQVGQTGKIVAPNLYIAAGISGSTQHMAGIKDSKVIVAINKDPDAPIFDNADLGIVADLYVAIPEIRAWLEAKGRN